jgi:hypothetical protein
MGAWPAEKLFRMCGSPSKRNGSGTIKPWHAHVKKETVRVWMIWLDVTYLFQALASVKLEHLVLETSIRLLHNHASVICDHDLQVGIFYVDRSIRVCLLPRGHRVCASPCGRALKTFLMELYPLVKIAVVVKGDGITHWPNWKHQKVHCCKRNLASESVWTTGSLTASPGWRPGSHGGSCPFSRSWE